MPKRTIAGKDILSKKIGGGGRCCLRSLHSAWDWTNVMTSHQLCCCISTEVSYTAVLRLSLKQIYFMANNVIKQCQKSECCCSMFFLLQSQSFLLVVDNPDCQVCVKAVNQAIPCDFYFHRLFICENGFFTKWFAGRSFCQNPLLTFPKYFPLCFSSILSSMPSPLTFFTSLLFL